MAACRAACRLRVHLASTERATAHVVRRVPCAEFDDEEDEADRVSSMDTVDARNIMVNLMKPHKCTPRAASLDVAHVRLFGCFC